MPPAGPSPAQPLFLPPQAFRRLQGMPPPALGKRTLRAYLTAESALMRHISIAVCTRGDSLSHDALLYRAYPLRYIQGYSLSRKTHKYGTYPLRYAREHTLSRIPLQCGAYPVRYVPKEIPYRGKRSNTEHIHCDIFKGTPYRAYRADAAHIRCGIHPRGFLIQRCALIRSISMRYAREYKLSRACTSSAAAALPQLRM